MNAISHNYHPSNISYPSIFQVFSRMTVAMGMMGMFVMPVVTVFSSYHFIFAMAVILGIVQLVLLGSVGDVIVRVAQVVVLFYRQEVFGRGLQLPIQVSEFSFIQSIFRQNRVICSYIEPVGRDTELIPV